MAESSGRRSPRKLSAETKWEVFLAVAAGEITQADAAGKWQVDVSTVIGIRRTVVCLDHGRQGSCQLPSSAVDGHMRGSASANVLVTALRGRRRA